MSHNMNNSKDDNSDMVQTSVKRILEAATDGNVTALQDNKHVLLSVTTECRNKKGWTPLMLATRNGHIEAMEFLLRLGADAKAINKSGQTPLDIATFWNQNAARNTLNLFLNPNALNYELVNHFSHACVDRQSYKRTDENHIREVKESEKARYMVFADLKLLITKNTPPQRGTRTILLGWNEVKKYLQSFKNDLIFIGVGNIETGKLLRETPTSDQSDLAYFAVNFKQDLSESDFPIAHLNGEFVGPNMNPGLMFLRKEESGVVAQAKSVLAWHDKYVFCPTCGSTTSIGDSGYKRICANADCISHRGAQNTCFPRTDAVVIALVISKDGSKCLLCRQGRHPPRMYSCVAGFMEPGETIEDAARREVMEETGVKVGVLKYHSSQPWPFPSNIMIGLIGNALCDDITVDEVEIEDARWFDRAEVATSLIEGFKRPEGLIVPPPYAIAHQLMKAWLQMSPNL